MPREKCLSCGKEAWFNVCECGKVLKTYDEKCRSCGTDCNEKNQNYKCLDCASKKANEAREKLVESLNDEQKKLFKDFTKKEGTVTSMIILAD